MMTDRDSDEAATPLATAVRYMLDDHGWPVVMVDTVSVAGSNVMSSPGRTSLHCHDVITGHFDSSEALGRITFIGEALFMNSEETSSWRTQMLKRFPKFTHLSASSSVVFKIRPDRLYFADDKGEEHWVNVSDYQHADADVLGSDLPRLVNRYVIENQMELKQLAKHSGGWIVDDVGISTIDRFGVTICGHPKTTNAQGSKHHGGCHSRAVDTTAGAMKEENAAAASSLRIPFGTAAASKEDVKSEMAKLFQDAWEKEHS
jgi:hypothetical protein